MDENREYRACPKCGGTNVKNSTVWWRQPRWLSVICNDCGFKGPEWCDEHGPPDSVDTWNALERGDTMTEKRDYRDNGKCMADTYAQQHRCTGSVVFGKAQCTFRDGWDCQRDKDEKEKTNHERKR
jgi:predicted RNA-binding Zn-ribbon protein involved in translation (DUF1610 family)